MSRKSISMAATALLALFAAVAFGQQVQPFGERVEVHIVEVDVVVTDRDGEPIRGLTAADFEMFENGARREITHFEEVAVKPDDRDVVSLPKRALIVFIDNRDLSRSLRSSLARSLGEIVAKLTSDGVAVTIAVWSDQLRVLAPLTTDAKPLEEAIHYFATDPTLTRGMLLSVDKREVLRQEPQLWSMIERARSRGVLNAMVALTQLVADQSTKKALLYVGRGFAVRPPEKRINPDESPEGVESRESPSLLRPPPGDNRREVGSSFDRRWLEAASASEAAGRIANRTGVTVYGLYGGGLEDTLDCAKCVLLPADIADGVASLETMAKSTGGVATATSNVTRRVVSQIRDDLNNYYTVAYQTESDGAGAVRKLEVRHRSGVRGRLRYRREVVLEPTAP